MESRLALARRKGSRNKAASLAYRYQTGLIDEILFCRFAPFVVILGPWFLVMPTACSKLEMHGTKSIRLPNQNKTLQRLLQGLIQRDLGSVLQM